MPSTKRKHRISSLPVFRVAGSHIRRFKVLRPDYPTGDIAPYGRIEPDHSPRLPESATKKPWGEIKAADALVAWFKVRTLFREWDYLRGRRIWLDEVKQRPHLHSRLSTRDLRSAAGRRPARERFDEALVKCVNDYGPLGVGDEVEEMMDAIDDLRFWMSPALTADSMFNAHDARLGKKLSGDLNGPLQRVDRAISMGGYTGGVIEKPNLYSALATALHYSQVLGIEFRQCAAPKCGTLFIAKRPDNHYCSNACVKAVSTLRKKAKQRRR